MSATAFLNSGIPPTGVYLVKLSLIALIAACFIFSGVLKSGSPAPKITASLPSFFSCFAFASIARVALGAMFLVLLDMNAPQTATARLQNL